MPTKIPRTKAEWDEFGKTHPKCPVCSYYVMRDEGEYFRCVNCYYKMGKK